MSTHEHSHPGAAEYVKIALILAVVTGAEVGLYYIGGLSDGLVVTLLLGMMVVKFAMVGMWFMHLKFDSPIFRRFFITGIVLAGLIYSVVLISTSGITTKVFNL